MKKQAKKAKPAPITETKSKWPTPLKLDLGAGNNPVPGFFAVDLFSPSPDLRLDLKKFPWPWADNSADEIHASHFIEHIEQEIRYRFFEECWRVMKPEAIMRIAVPNWKSERSYGDMDHKMPPVTNFFFFYLNRSWREANKLTYGPYALKCHFEHQAGPLGFMGDWGSKAQEVQIFAATHYLESFADMWVVLTKKEM